MKRINVLLSLVLAAAVGLFGVYLLWIHNNLDTTGPVISIDEELLVISVEDPEEALFQGITATDERSGDVTGSLLVESIYGINEENMTTVVYAAFDHAGNVSKAARQIRYDDYRHPRFELLGSLTFPAGSGYDVLDFVGASDVIEGDIRRRVHATLVSDTKSLNEVGTHKVRFQVTNSLGDTVELDLPVEVYDPQWYSARVELEEYLIYIKQGSSFRAEDYLKTFLLRGDEIDLSYRIPEDVVCEINGTVNTQVPGVYDIDFILSKNVSLETFSGQAKLIVVVEE